MDSVTIGIRAGRVVGVNNTTKLALNLSWRAADAIGRAMAHKARGVINPDSESFVTISLRREGEEIIIITAAGQTFLIAPLAVAAEIGYALIAQARKLEEMDSFERLAMDQAILQRSGMPFGLTRNPKIQQEAGKLAAWDSNLRRYIKGNRLSQRQVGTPRVGEVIDAKL